MSNSDTAKNRQLIKGMFSEIAETYDRANSVLSLGLHFLWKKKLIAKVLALRGNGAVLDVCTGTGDILKGLRKSEVNAFGIDFAYPMLSLQPPGSRIAQADALQLPFRQHSFEIATVSYGVRNFEVLETGLKEIFRVLKPGGTLLILEFGKKPEGFIGSTIRFYENIILPTLGGIISGKAQAYRYLAKSSNEFPSSEDFISICKKVGFREGRFEVICFGATYLYELKA